VISSGLVHQIQTRPLPSTSSSVRYHSNQGFDSGVRQEKQCTHGVKLWCLLVTVVECVNTG